MKVALLLYGNEDFEAMSPDDQAAIVGAYAAYSERLVKAGAFVCGEPLDDSATGRTLAPDGTVQDGPYSDTREQLGGLYIIEVASLEAAIDWARQCPNHSHGGHIEVRPVPDYIDG